jgi:peptidoglycan/xylan/chitin deacetylase (PgdA/CDA1 family)
LRIGRLMVALGTLVLAVVLVVSLLGGGSGGSGGGRSAVGAAGAGAAGAARSRLTRGEALRPGAARRHVPLLALPSSPAPRTVQVPILTWHRVAVFANEYTKSIPDETVEPSVFAEEMSALASHDYHPISQLQLFNALFHGAPLPPRPVLLTVDDGYVDDVKTILPILQAHHFVATFYIITGRFHEPGFLNATEVRRLDTAGMDIGAHTRTHVPLAAIPTSELREQIKGSREDLEHILGHPVQWFAYPFGSYDATVIEQVQRAGFVLAVTTNGGTSESAQAPLTLPRIHIGRTATAATVLACASAPGACGGGGGG